MSNLPLSLPLLPANAVQDPTISSTRRGIDRMYNFIAKAFDAPAFGPDNWPLPPPKPGQILVDTICFSGNNITALAYNAYLDTTSTWYYLGTGPATAINMGNGNIDFFTAVSHAGGFSPVPWQTQVSVRATDPGTTGSIMVISPTRIRFSDAGDEGNAGTIDYRGFDAGAFSIVGAGTTSTTRTVRIWDILNISAMQLYYDGANYRLETPGALYFNAGSGQPVHINSDLYVLSSLFVGGLQAYNNAGYFYFVDSLNVNDLTSRNNITVAGSVFIGGTQVYNNAGYVYTPNGYGANGDIYTNSSLRAGGNLVVSGVLQFGPGLQLSRLSGTPDWVYSGGNGYYTSYAVEADATGTAFYGPNGNITCVSGFFAGTVTASQGGVVSSFYSPNASGGAVFLASAGGMSATAFNIISDAKTKENIEESVIGLDQILQLSPKVFNRVATPQRKELGLIAQEVETVLSLAVVPIEASAPPVRLLPGEAPVEEAGETLLTVDYAPITVALVNAVKELSARITKLEAR